MDNTNTVVGFEPIYDQNIKPTLLILGSAPSVKSLAEQQYYAHPQNAFWWILSQLFCFDVDLPYAQRIPYVTNNGVIIWDVLKSCQREGSLDSRIQNEIPNDIDDLLRSNNTIRMIACNGGAAYKLLRKYHSNLFEQTYKIIQLPSTSSAYASLSKQDKLIRWQKLLMLGSKNND